MRTDSTWRSGRKAIAGCTEDWVAGNVVGGSFTSALTAVAAAFAAELPISGYTSIKPVLVRLLADYVVDAAMDIGGCIYKRVTTQNTRKP